MKGPIYPYFFLLPLLMIFCMCPHRANGQNETQRIDVGVILDTGTWIGKISKSCISMALSDFYSTHRNYTTRLVLHTRDSKEDVVEAASAAIDLLKNVQVQALLGPQSSSEAKFVVNVVNKSQVPIISFSATTASLSPTETPYFVRTAVNDTTQVKAIAAIVKAFGWREVVPIYEETEYGKDIIPYLTDAIQEVNARIPYRCVISPIAANEQIESQLFKLMTMQTRVFVVHMKPSLGIRLFAIAKRIGLMKIGCVWIITDGLTDLVASSDSSSFNSMQGVLGVKPYVPKSSKLDSFRRRWRRNLIQESPNIDTIEPSIYGLWAYDSVWALAEAAEKVLPIGPSFRKPNTTRHSTDLDSLPISQTGVELLKEILQTKLTGLSGPFWLKEGQLQSSAFQIVNVFGKGGREIGFWSPTYGISKKMGPTNRKMYSTSINELRTIIWPGNSTVVPKGWEEPTSERKLRIGVPATNGYKEFVNVKRDLHTNATMITGFCIDVFKAVIDSMPYVVPYEFVPFMNDDGQSAGTYDDLIDQIYYENYDAVVGDTTILLERTSHVDFTLPYTASGVSMLVPIKDDNKKNAWIFLTPLTRDLWITIGTFFIFTGFVVWVLEHRVNREFRGSPSQQVGMIFWFSFSTLVFAHKERVISNLARFVLIIWVFVVLILTSSYTASLTSRLTLQQLQPTVTDIKDLIENGDYVGYQRASFTRGVLQSMGFDQSKLKFYDTLEQFEEALSRGSKNGGISAIIDETPYIGLFLAKYCGKYTLVGPTYKTAGFGFAFPKRSPLVADISRAILNVTEGDKILAIERKWFGNQTTCPEQAESRIASDSLTLDSFRGLFLVSGVASSVALLLFFLIFLFEHKDILTSQGSVSQKLFRMARQFDKKRDDSSTLSENVGSSFRRSETKGEEGDLAEHDGSHPERPGISHCHHSDMIFSQEERFSSTEPSTTIEDNLALREITAV